MSLETKLSDFAAAVGSDIKNIILNAGDLSSLTTAEKTSLVLAINEIKQAQANATGINDTTASTSSTYSGTKIDTLINDAVAAIINSSPAALDTLNELAAALGNDENFASNLVTTLAKKVGVTAQTFTAPEKLQARTNIDAVSSGDFDDYKALIGDTTVDLVSVYTTAKT